MCITCHHACHMTVMMQIRNVADALHCRLKSRATLAGMSLSDYLLSGLRQVAERPARDAPLLTRDRRLAAAAGHRARIEPV